MKQNLELRISSKVNRSADELCDAILGLHASTGCDSVSAFAGKGKSKAIKILITSDEYIDLFKNFGQQWQVNKDEMAALECFTCELYGQKRSLLMMFVTVCIVIKMETLVRRSCHHVQILYVIMLNVLAIKQKFRGHHLLAIIVLHH